MRSRIHRGELSVAGWLALLAAVGLSCGLEEDRRPSPARPIAGLAEDPVCGAVCRPGGSSPSSWTIEYGGCLRTYASPAGTTCVVPYDAAKRRLRLWICSPPGSRPVVEISGRSVADTGIAADGARHFSLETLSIGDRITVRDAAGSILRRWQIVLSAWPEWLDEANRLAFEKWEMDAARELLRTHLEKPGTAAAHRGAALSLLARFGAPGTETLLAEAIEIHRAAGRGYEETADTVLLARQEIDALRFTDARRRLEALELGPDAPAEALFQAAFGRALLADRTGDVRTANGEMECAAAWARRFGLERDLWMAEQYRCELLQDLGRFEEAAQVLAGLRRDPPPVIYPCDPPLLDTNEGWNLYWAREAGADLGDPLRFFAAAREGYDREGCRLDQRINARLNLAFAHLQDGRPAAARPVLGEIEDLEAVALPFPIGMALLEAEGQLALAEDRPRHALEIFERADERAADGFDFAGRWRATVGRGQAHVALGDTAAALAALAEAEDLLDERSLQIPVEAGRESFAGQHQEGTRLRLDLLLESGRGSEALALARRSRARALRHLWRGDRLALLDDVEQVAWDEALAAYLELRAALVRSAEEEWQLPVSERSRAATKREGLKAAADEALSRALAVLEDDAARFSPPPPLPGEVILAYHPLPRGWVGLAATGERLKVHRFSLPDGIADRPHDLAAAVLEPFADLLAAAERVRILPYGDLRQVDFHALPLGDDVLLAALPVVYGLDLGASPPSSFAGSRRALIIADPRGDLSHTRREAEDVSAILGDLGWSNVHLAGSRAALEPVRAALAEADFLHYAGHSEFAGRGGWESSLLLAGEARFTLGDLLALERVPRFVVLSACESGRTAAGVPVESLGLAQAFLLAGAQGAVATVRPVDDRAAADLIRHFYRGFRRDSSAGSLRSSSDDFQPVPDLPALLREAQLDWRRLHPRSDWASFRAFEP